MSLPAACEIFLQMIPDSKGCQLDVWLRHYTSGITKLNFQEILQEFWKCAKEIAITVSFDVKKSKTIRKLVVGEIVAVLEGPKIDDVAGLERIRCCALLDLKDGWATLRGNQGTNFLERTVKPYYCCEAQVQLQAAFESSSPETSKARRGEILEVIEGPRKEPASEIVRVWGKAVKDGKTGWVTLKDAKENSSMELMKIMICKVITSVTSTFDIQEAKTIRKLDVNEILEVLEGPIEDTTRHLMRCRIKAKKDDEEGWVTTKGNQGTIFTEKVERHYICTEAHNLEARVAIGSDTVRTLDVDEVFEALDVPKTELMEGVERMRGRSLTGDVDGWLTFSKQNLQPWSPHYKCVHSTTIHDRLTIAEAKTIRRLEVSETLEAVEAPVWEEAAGVLRVRARAEKDGLIGFVTIKGNQGTVLLKPILDVSS